MVNVEQSIVNWLFTAAGAAFGWVLKVLWDAMQDLKKDVRLLERELPGIYVRKDDFKEAMRDLKVDMRQGFDKLDAALLVLAEKVDQQQGRN